MKLFSKNKYIFDYNIIFFVLLSIFGGLYVFYSTINHGSALTSDSVSYIGTARNIIDGKGLINYNGEYLVYFPPLYAILLATSSFIIKFDPLDVAVILNSIIHGLIIFFSGILLKNIFNERKIFAGIGVVIVLCSPILFKISIMALSDSTFILLVILSLYISYIYIYKKKYLYLFLLSLTVAAATLTKYVGLTLIFWGIIVITIAHNSYTKSKIKHVLLFSIFSSIPLGLWLIRNFILSGTITGERSTHSLNYFYTVNTMLTIIIKWFIHPIFINNYNCFLHIFLILISLATLYVLSKFNKSIKPTFILLFVLIYFAFLTYTMTNYSIDLDDRLLSPLYIPLIITMLHIVQVLYNYFRKYLSDYTLKTIVLLIFILWLIYPVRATILFSNKLRDGGGGYNSIEWKNNQLANHLKENYGEYRSLDLYSNSPYATYILTGLLSDITPYKLKTVDSLNVNWPMEDKAYIIWYKNINQNALLSLNEIETISNLTEIINFSDGILLSVTSD